MKTNVKLLQNNRLIGTRVHAEGDVVEMDHEVAKQWVKLGYAAVTNQPVTPVPSPAPSRHSKNPFPVTRTASDPAGAAALKAAEERDGRKPKRTAVG